jgi:hypothetical protein
MTNQSVKNPVARRLNVVFREFGLPQHTEANPAIRQAEENYQFIRHGYFWEKCQVAMGEMSVQEASEMVKAKAA